MAHGVVGKRLFVEPFVAEDANVFSEFDLLVPSYQPGVEEDELELGSKLTLRLTENLGLELEGEWVRADSEESGAVSGFQNTELVFKYAAFRSPAHEWIGTVAAAVEFPTGAEKVGAEGFYSFDTGFFFGKGLGDLPESLRYLRPLMVQGDAVVHHHLTSEAGEAFNALSYDFFIAYSLPYLQQNVKDLGLPRPLNRFFPMVELNYTRVLNGPDLGRLDGSARPGLMWVGKGMQLGIAAQIPVTQAGRDERDIGAIGIISLYLDDLYPGIFRDPILGQKR
jgi:hypothetical protein